MASKFRLQKKLRVPDEIVPFVRGCHPQLKRKIRAGLRHILNKTESGKSLKEERDGLRSCRISRFRIIYRLSSKQIIEVVAIGPRKTIYEETYRIMKKEVLD
jgi:mRNA interferase RelE/StbE